MPYADGQKEKAQWQVMIGGLRKPVMNAGVLSDWNVQVVQEGDEFEYQLGDNPFIHHKPSATGGRARKVLFAYSIATYPDGTKSREVMNGDQIADIMRLSKAGEEGPLEQSGFLSRNGAQDGRAAALLKAAPKSDRPAQSDFPTRR